MIEITVNTSVEELANLYALEAGSVFKMDFNHFEEIVDLIIRNIPEGTTWDFFPVNPGTDLYTMYGPSHCVVFGTAN